ncbi:30S ribosomal protein S1, partial [Bacteroidales bacterium AH-315-I05]|nr:30S ribosomal protein S1 [Bacteroidales bacterium AH-315-I05]
MLNPSRCAGIERDTNNKSCQKKKNVTAEETVDSSSESTLKEEQPEQISEVATEPESAKPTEAAKEEQASKEQSDTPVQAETAVEEVEVAVEEKPQKSSKKKDVSKDNGEEVISEKFDWAKIGKKQDTYSAKERKELEETYSKTLTLIAEREVVDGIVVLKTKKEVIINIGYKSEGIINASEFRYNSDLKIGDTVEAYIEATEDKNGQLVLSHSKARTLRAWERINKSLTDDVIINGQVKCRTKGGLIVDIFGLEAFLPGSQIDVKPIRDYDLYVGKTMEFKVVKINHEFKNVVVSHKALIEAELELQKIEIMSKLEKGQVLEGVVKNITSYGVFIDLGGVDGLIHITDLSWGRINHPEEIVELDQTLNVVILDFDDEKKRIALGLKQLEKHPWESLDEKFKVGDKIKGKVVVLADYGAFVEIQPGIEGLIHVSEMSWSQHLRSAQDFFKVSDEVEAVIMTLDREDRKMSLSTRQLAPDPWDEVEKKYPAESKHKGKVTNISHFGVFVELEEGVDGLVHISDLSWSKKINHPSEFTKIGEEMEVAVLEIDKENRRLSLGHKQLEENPWETFETVFTENSIHSGTIISQTDKGFVVGMPYGVEAFCPGKHSVKEDNSKPAVDDTLDFMVIEFSKQHKKIIVSHARIHEDAAEVEKGQKDKKKKTKSKSKSTHKAVKKITENLEKTTLGDLDVLANLKDEMDE